MKARKKLELLRNSLNETGGIAIAFSGGVDSTFLAAVAKQELGDRMIAVTALSQTYPAAERASAAKLASFLRIRHETVEWNALEVPNFAENPVDRCYYCKRELLRIIKKVAICHGFNAVADGTNADDLKDYRPGRRAAEQFGVLSPLMDAGLGKDEIRKLSRTMGLPTADKPAQACLASRFPYGSRITEEKLKAVDVLEDELRKMGFQQVRVRHHGEIARIEIDPSDLGSMFKDDMRREVVRAAIKAGFFYVTADLEGYRTGSMNGERVPCVAGDDAGFRALRLSESSDDRA